MAYIGNTVQNQGFAPAVDYFNGDGTTVTFTLSRPVASVAQLTAVIDNVIQNPSSAFTVTGNAITFTSAPLSGTNNIWVEYTSLVTTYGAISQDPSVIGDLTASGGFLSTGDFGNTYTDGTIVDYVTGNARITTGPVDGLTIYNGGPTARYALAAWDTSGNLVNTGDGTFSSTGFLKVPSGTTAQRPISPVNGMVRYNTTTAKFEVYQSGSWVNYALSYDIQVLIVAGGGGGSTTAGGGGGGGGYIATSLTVNSAGSYAITVGAGGAGATFDGGNGSIGAASAFALTTTVGGGGGGHGTPSSGGSGGGGGYGGFIPGAAGTSGQGFAGGAGGNLNAPQYPCGGGGGAGAVGGSVTAGSTNGGLGGAGAQWLNGSYYAGGGGGSGTGNAAGGVGGGGRGGLVADATKLPGTANTGGGGGGGGFGGSGGAIGNGGSGVVIVRYEGAQKGTGGTVTSSGGYTYHTFTTSGTFTA